MKQLMFLAAVAATTLSFGALPKPNVTPPKPSGGVLERVVRTRVFVVRDKQTKFSAQEIDEAARELKSRAHIPVKLVRGDEPVKDGGATLTLTDTPTLPGLTLIAAPEQGVGYLATDWLLADSPDAEKRATRLQIEIVRAALATLGVGYSMYQPCVMTYVSGLKELDRMRMDHPNPETENNTAYGAKHRGIKKTSYATYRRACEEGWAPAPTNAEQKAVWDDVHRLPTDPIVIAPETEKQK